MSTATNYLPKIALVVYESRDLITYPTITQALTLLSQSDYEIDVYIPDQMKTDFNYKRVNIINTNQRTAVSFICKTLSLSEQASYQLIIACNFEGLVVAQQLNQSKSLPTVYLSLELIYDQYGKKLMKKMMNYRLILGSIIDFGLRNLSFMKHLFPKNICSHAESASANLSGYLMLYKNYLLLRCSGDRFIKFGIIQDQYRAKCLREQFPFIKKVAYLPNSYLGFHNQSSSYAFRKFRIPKDKKIILYTGGLEKGFDERLFSIIPQISEQYIFLFHVFSRDGYINVIKKKHKQLLGKRVIIHEQILQENEYDKLTRSSYIGLAWYSRPDKHDDNMYYLGLSSGKLCKFLSCNKPIIAPNYFYNYEKLINNKMGITCQNATQIPKALNIIDKKYTYFQKNIKSYYYSNLEFKHMAIPIIDKIQSCYDQS